jgi:hypothetical protein
MVSTPLTWTFENQGDIIRMDNVVTKKFLKLAGRKGFGVSPTRLVMREGAAEGSRHRRTKRLARSIDFPLAIFGADREEVENSFRRFVRLVQDDVTAPRLVATYPDGSRVYTEIHFSGGLDPVYGSDDTQGRDFAKCQSSFISPSPYWTDEDAINYPFNFNVDASDDNWVEDMAEMPLISSQTAGSVSIENPGDVAAYPVWTLQGPMDTFSASYRGQGFTYTEHIALGETITVNTVTKTVTDQDGVNKYGALGTAPKLFPIPKGSATVDILADNTDANSLVSMYFNARRELVFG